MIILAAAVGLIAIVWAIVAFRRPSEAQRRQQRLDTDAELPGRAWVQAAFLVVTGDLDYGHLPRAEARQMLIHWWEIHGPYELRCGLDDLENPGRPDNAWDLLRCIVVTRLGAAAQYLSDDAAWDRIEPVALRLQTLHRSWTEMAQSYVVARRQWKGIAVDGSEDDDGMRRILDNVANLRDGRWTHVAWDTELDNPHNFDRCDD